MNVVIKGQFKAIGETKETTNGKTIQKFYLDIDVDSQYPTIFEFQNYDNRVNLASIKPGDVITVHSNPSGRKWTSPEGKSFFFQSFNAWKIETETIAPVTPKVEPAEPEPIGSGDLPF